MIISTLFSVSDENLLTNSAFYEKTQNGINLFHVYLIRIALHNFDATWYQWKQNDLADQGETTN